MTDKTMHEAFIEAYAEMTNPKKNASNPAFKSKYANLEELLNVTRPVLTAEGFAIVQEPVSDEGCIGVRTRLIFKTGESLDFGSYAVPLDKHNAQGAGSAITYARRYALAAIFGLAQEDDDGNAASKPAAAPAQPAKPADPFALMVTVADLKGNKDAVSAALGHPETKKAARAAYEAKDAAGRREIDEIAESGASEVPF